MALQIFRGTEAGVSRLAEARGTPTAQEIWSSRGKLKRVGVPAIAQGS